MKVEDIINCCNTRSDCGKGTDNECPCIKECELLRGLLKEAEPHNLKEILEGSY